MRSSSRAQRIVFAPTPLCTLPMRRLVIRPGFASIANMLREEFVNKRWWFFEIIYIDWIMISHIKETAIAINRLYCFGELHRYRPLINHINYHLYDHGCQLELTCILQRWNGTRTSQAINACEPDRPLACDRIPTYFCMHWVHEEPNFVLVVLLGRNWPCIHARRMALICIKLGYEISLRAAYLATALPIHSFFSRQFHTK